MKESDIQIQIVDYLKLIRGIIYFSVTNEGFAPRKGRATGPQLSRLVKFKRMGLRAGVADLVICKDGKVFFLEVKTPKGSMSENQKIFKADADLTLCPYAVVKSFDAAVNQLREWGIV